MAAVVVVIKDLDTNQISQLVYELKQQGYKVGIDFDFEYSPGRFDYQIHTDIARQTKFTFYNSKLTTWFALRWS